MSKQKTTLTRQIQIIKEYDKVVAETPEEYRLVVTKVFFHRMVAKRLGTCTFKTVGKIVNQRVQILKEYKEHFGIEA